MAENDYNKCMSIGMESGGLAYLGPIVGHLLAMLLMILPVLVDVDASEKLRSNSRSRTSRSSSDILQEPRGWRNADPVHHVEGGWRDVLKKCLTLHFESVTGCQECRRATHNMVASCQKAVKESVIVVDSKKFLAV